MLYYRHLPIIKTVIAPHDFVLAEIGYPIARRPFNFFIDEVLDPNVDLQNSFYKKHWPVDDLLVDRIRMCQAKVVEQDGFNGSEPIDVMVNDIGQFVILDGNHRACIQSRFCGGNIRMNVRYISPTWKKVVDAINGMRDAHGILYQKIDHPYFSDYPYHRGESRAKAILESIRNTKTINNFVFEIGCNTGLFSRMFSAGGLFPFGFDIASDNIAISEILSRSARLRGYYFHEPDVLSMLRIHPDNAIGSITCVSVIHHYLRKGDRATFLEYIKQVSRVGSVAYFDDETEDDERRRYYKNGNFPDGKYMEDAFLGLSLNFEKIHTCSIGRTIYKVWKKN